VQIPNCAHEVITALKQLRRTKVDVGQSVQLPVSDGRKSAAVKIEAQERERVITPAGAFNAVRYEINILNGVVYSRAGRVFIWLTDDERRLPVQIRLRMNFPLGTVTLELEKEEHP
jgi:CRISPR/Cas system-associated protein Csx1